MKKTLKRRDVADIVGVSERQINKLVASDGFPKPVKIGKLDMWVDSEVQAWIDARISERDADLVVGGEG